MSTDFDPVVQAQRISRLYRSSERDEVINPTDVGVLVDYIDALVAALDDTDGALRALDRSRNSVTAAQVEAITHTNRHLLEG